MTRAAFFTAVCMVAGVLTVAPEVHAEAVVLSGYVTDADGAPVDDATVYVGEANASGHFGGASTNVDGYYQMSVQPGTYDIQAVRWTDRTYAAFIEDVVVGAPRQLDLTLELGTATMTVSGTVPLTGLVGDLSATVQLKCGEGSANTTYLDVPADGSYSATVEAPEVATCWISLRSNPFDGLAVISRDVQLIDGSAVVDFVYPDTLELEVETADGLAATDGSIEVSAYGTLVMPDGVTATVSTLFGGGLEDQPFTMVMVRSTETEFVHHATLSSQQVIDTTDLDAMVLTLPAIDTFVLTGSVEPLPDEGEAEVTATCGEDNENNAMVVDGTYEIEMSALAGSWCEITLTAQPLGTGNVLVTRPLPATGATRTADLPYAGLVIVTVLTAEGDPVQAGSVELFANGPQVMPDGVTALLYSSDRRELDGQAIYTKLRRGQTAWRVTLEDGTQLHGEVDSTASNEVEITLPQMTTFQVTGAVTDPDDTLLGGTVTVTCDAENSVTVEVDPPGSYSASVVAPVGSECEASLWHNRPEGSVSMTRDVELTGEVGVADFRIPPTLALHVIDTRGGPINARTRLVSAGHATMPDGVVAWAQSELTAAGDVGETAAPLIRSVQTYYTVYDDLRNHTLFTGVFDTTGVDVVTFDLATGVMTAGGPDVAEVTITGTVLLSDGSPGYGTLELECDDQTSGSSVNGDGTYSVSMESAATQCTIKVRANDAVGGSVRFERLVSISDEIGEADFQFPAPMTFNFVDPTGDPILAAASVSSFGDVTMPDGELASVTTTASLVPIGSPLNAPMVRANPMYYNLEDYTHNAEYWSSIDTTSLDEVTFVMSTGGAVGGSPTSSLDGDGVSDVVEAGAPNGGDGNNDGTPDHQQANVTSLPSWAGPYVSIAAPAGTTLVDVSAVDPASYGTPPAGQTLPDGLFAFTIDGVAVGGSTTVRIHTPSAATSTGYAKFHDGAWSVLPAANVTVGDTWVELTLVDGGVGDDDGAADGSITDPGGVVLIADTTPPEVTCAAAPTTWSATNVSIACTATDTGSGLADPGDASFSLTTAVASGLQTANASTDQRSVCDLVGNCSTAGPIGGIKVDRANPTISLVSPIDAATVPQGAVVVAGYSCADGGSGIASCVGTRVDGAAIDTATLGPRSFTVTAHDAVGNVSSQSVTFTVVATNAPPMVRADLGVAGLNDVGFRTRSVTISGSFTDSDGVGPYQAMVRWSPTSSFVPLSTLGTLFAGSTTYSSAGARVVTVRVCDRAGACGTDTLTVRAGVTTNVRPVVQCVADRGARTSPRYLARLGYDNPAAFAIVVPTAPASENTFTAAPYYRGQPQLFLPGQQRNVFQVSFANGTQRWRLNGTEVSMSSSTRRC